MEGISPRDPSARSVLSSRARWCAAWSSVLRIHSANELSEVRKSTVMVAYGCSRISNWIVPFPPDSCQGYCHLVRRRVPLSPQTKPVTGMEGSGGTFQNHTRRKGRPRRRIRTVSDVPETLGWLMLGATIRCADQDSEDLKAFVESCGEIRLCGEDDS